MAPPTRRPRAYHRVNPYPGARRQNETNVFRSRLNESVDHNSFSYSSAMRKSRHNDDCIDCRSISQAHTIMCLVGR